MCGLGRKASLGAVLNPIGPEEGKHVQGEPPFPAPSLVIDAYKEGAWHPCHCGKNLETTLPLNLKESPRSITAAQRIHPVGTSPSTKSRKDFVTKPLSPSVPLYRALVISKRPCHCLISISQPWHYWHLGAGSLLLCAAVLRTVREVITSPASTLMGWQEQPPQQQNTQRFWRPALRDKSNPH